MKPTKGRLWTAGSSKREAFAHIVVCAQGEDYFSVNIPTAEPAVPHVIDGSKCRCQDMLDGEYLPHAVSVRDI